jgi:hypothetical protein
MSVVFPTINVATDTFQNWIDKTNTGLAQFANGTLTANTHANGSLTTGNAAVNGIFTSTTLTAISELRGGTVQTPNTLNITTNTAINGGSVLTIGANVTANSSTLVISNTVVSDVRIATGNSSINTTATPTTFWVGGTYLVVNSVGITVGNSIVVNSSVIMIGNSTINATMNSTSVSVGGNVLPTNNTKATVAVANVLIGSAGRINFVATGTAGVGAFVDANSGQITVQITATANVGSSGGSNTNILFNDGGLIGGNTGFTFQKDSNNVFLANTLTIGTNASINSTALIVGTTTMNSNGITIGGNVSISTSGFLFGNSTVNSTANSTSLKIGTLFGVSDVAIVYNNVLSINTTSFVYGNTTLTTGSVATNTANFNTSLQVATNFAVNSTVGVFGNSTVASTANTTALQVANSTIAAIIRSSGLTIGSNVSLTYANLMLGSVSVQNTVVTSPSYTGNGVMQSANTYWNNTAGIVATTDQLNAAGAYITIADSGTPTWDMFTGINFQWILGGNRTLPNATNQIVGRSGVLWIKQDATGGRTLSFGNNYIFDGNVIPSIGTTANISNFLFYTVLPGSKILVALTAKSVTA